MPEGRRSSGIGGLRGQQLIPQRAERLHIRSHSGALDRLERTSHEYVSSLLGQPALHSEFVGTPDKIDDRRRSYALPRSEVCPTSERPHKARWVVGLAAYPLLLRESFRCLAKLAEIGHDLRPLPKTPLVARGVSRLRTKGQGSVNPLERLRAEPELQADDGLFTQAVTPSFDIAGVDGCLVVPLPSGERLGEFTYFVQTLRAPEESSQLVFTVATLAEQVRCFPVALGGAKPIACLVQRRAKVVETARKC